MADVGAERVSWTVVELDARKPPASPGARNPDAEDRFACAAGPCDPNAEQLLVIPPHAAAAEVIALGLEACVAESDAPRRRDRQFADFLRAGAARVVFPVRPGFEAAVVHYLETSEIWNGGPPPEISNSLYVPIIKEIRESTGAMGSEIAVGDPWLVHLPTTLVRLRPNDDLPVWQRVGDDWQPAN